MIMYRALHRHMSANNATRSRDSIGAARTRSNSDVGRYPRSLMARTMVERRAENRRQRRSPFVDQPFEHPPVGLVVQVEAVVARAPEGPDGTARDRAPGV